jgi:hypothetical protein
LASSLRERIEVKILGLIYGRSAKIITGRGIYRALERFHFVQWVGNGIS